MKLRFFLLASLIIHLCLFGALYLIPAPPQSSGGGERPLIARLVEPPPAHPRRPKKLPGQPLKKVPERIPTPRLSEPLPKQAPETIPLPKKEVLPERPALPPERGKKALPLPRKEPSSRPSLKTPPRRGGTIERGKTGGPLPEKGSGSYSKERSIKRGRLPTRRELFNPELIDRLARRFERKEREKRGNRNKGITFDAKELRFKSYLMKLKSRIEHIWVYPRELAEQGIFGDLYIQFTIRKDGSLGEVKLLRTSGYRELDRAAMRALKDGAPYWPLPEKWEEEAITITGHFIYTLSGFYIR